MAQAWKYKVMGTVLRAASVDGMQVQILSYPEVSEALQTRFEEEASLAAPVQDENAGKNAQQLCTRSETGIVQRGVGSASACDLRQKIPVPVWVFELFVHGGVLGLTATCRHPLFDGMTEMVCQNYPGLEFLSVTVSINVKSTSRTRIGIAWRENQHSVALPSSTVDASG